MIAPSAQHRRMTDTTDEEILALINRATTDGEKAHLTVLYQINKNLVENTILTTDVVKRLDAQEKTVAAHRALVDRGLTSWKVATVFIGTLAAIIIYIVTGDLNEMKERIKTDAKQDLAIQLLQTDTPISKEAAMRLKVLETQLVNNTGLLIDLQHQMMDHAAGGQGLPPRRPKP